MAHKKFKSLNIDEDCAHFSFNGQLLLKELQKHNVDLAPIGNTNFFLASFNNHEEVFHELYTSRSPYTQGIMIDDKYYTKQYLKDNGILVAEGEVFPNTAVDKAIQYAQQIGYPVVLKPTVGSHGDYIFLDIDTSEDLTDKLFYYQDNNVGNGFCLIEKQYNLNEFRLFISKNGFFAAVSRIPANVIGDGIKTIRQLADEESYRRMNPRTTCLCTIKLDDVTVNFLQKQNLTLESIPAKNQKIFLRRNSNVTTGGNCYDATDQVHTSVIKRAQKILELWNVPFLGIDYLCQDITKQSDEYIICELNSSPGLSMHMMPEKGESRNVADAIVHTIFPEIIHD